MMAARREEVREHQVAGYVGTLAAVARTLDLERARYDWLAEHVGEIPEEPPMTSAEALEWHGLMTDSMLWADEAEAVDRIVEPGPAS